MTLIVRSTQIPLLWDTTSIIERVPDLEPLAPGRHYELVGAPTNHAGTNDPCREPASLLSWHNSNHWGTRSLSRAIQNIAAAYDSLNPGIRLRINDMSLELGGLFDIGNRWKTGTHEGHAEHRIGENADIGLKGINSQNECIDLNTIRLLRVIEAYTLGRVRTHDDHYHVRIR